MAIFFKFTAALNFDRLEIETEDIKVVDLRRRILDQKGLSEENDTLEISNANTKESTMTNSDVYLSPSTFLGRILTVMIV